MAYDNLNKYPEPGSAGTTTSGGSGIPDSGSLKDRCISAIRSCSLDMDKLQADRARYMKYYLGEKLGNEMDGRSQVVMSTVQDTIESIMPDMMRIFYGGDQVLNIRPQGPEDEVKCKLMEEKINFDIQKGLDGFRILYSFIKDSLINKCGVVKYYWLKDVKFGKPVTQAGLDEMTAMGLLNDPGLKIDSFESRTEQIEIAMTGMMDAMGMPMPPMMQSITKYDVTYRRMKKISKPVVENLPPEEFIFDIRARSIDKAFCAHKKRIHKSKLKGYGLTDDEVASELDGFRNDQIVQERFRDLGGTTFVTPKADNGYVYIYECYICDYDEEGNEKPMLVTLFGDRVIREEENSYGRPPFIVMSPIIIPHRICGRGIAELVCEIQKLHTMMVRYILDNIYFQNNGMKIVNPFRINVDSIKAANKPGGIAFTKFDIDPNTAVMPMPVTPLPPHMMNLLEYVEGMKENRTGITRYNQGLDARSLNKTATGISIIRNAAQQRVELIARIFAETGIKNLYEAMVRMNLDYFDSEVAVKINQNWRNIRPEDIDGDFDVIVDVGVGVGTKEMAFQQKSQMLNIYGMIGKILGPQAQAIFGIDNVKNIIKGMWEDMGYKNVTEYVAPDQPPMPPPMPPGGMNGPQPGAGMPPEGLPGNGGGAPFGPPDLAGVFPQMGGGLQGPPMGMPTGGMGGPQGY